MKQNENKTNSIMNLVAQKITFEPPHGKTNNLHRRKQRRRADRLYCYTCSKTKTDDKEGMEVYMSRHMGKPTICIGENKDADQLRGNREADQRLCFRYSDSTIPPLLNSKISSF